MLMLKDKLKAAAITLGLFISYSTMSTFKEKVFRDEYDDEKFVYPITYVAVQGLVNTIVSKAMLMTHNHPANETPQKFYILIAFLTLLPMITSNMSLQYIPFVVLLVGKSCRPIPVMIFSSLFAKKSYTIQRYFFIALIAFGVGLFAYKEGLTSSNQLLLGYILVFTSLLLEGILGGTQANMRISSKPTSINYMFYVNLWTFLLVIPLTFVKFEGYEFILYCVRHKQALLIVTAATITGSIEEYFASAMISNFGPLPLALISTIRKFVTVLISALIFGNVLSLRQWIATVIIFEGLILDVFFGKKNEEEKDEKNVDETVKEITAKGVINDTTENKMEGTDNEAFEDQAKDNAEVKEAKENKNADTVNTLDLTI